MRPFVVFGAILGSLLAVVWCAKQVAKPVLVPVNNQSNILGGDRDEYGCIGSAGYSWCKDKAKCIRIFEEDCLSEVEIKQVLANKYQKNPEQVLVKISAETPQYAKGSVRFDINEGPGGLFLATKISGKWEVVFDGNGSVDCLILKNQYAFPADILEGVCD